MSIFMKIFTKPSLFGQSFLSAAVRIGSHAVRMVAFLRV